MPRIPFFLIFGVLSLLHFSACKTDKPAPETPAPDAPPSRAYKVPAFSADTAYYFIEKQVAFGPRVPNSAAHKACKEWLVAQLKSYGLDVVEQDFKAKAYTGETLNGTNIIGRHNPQAAKRIVLAAHWDTRHIADSPIADERKDEPILGADDGGSGVGVLLEIARLLQEYPIEAQDLGVDIVLFDLEDYGEAGGDHRSYCLGSQHWSKNLHAPNYKPRYGILLDMVGAKGARFTKERFSMTYAPDLMNRVWRLASGMGFGHFFVDVQTPEIIDDHYFVNTIARIPMIDIINRPAGSQTGFGEHWHTHRDDMDIIDINTLKAVGQVVAAVVWREAGGTF